MLWPDLDAHPYRRADTETATEKFLTVRRETIARLRKLGDYSAGTVGALASAPEGLARLAASSDGALEAHAPAAAHFLDADREYLGAIAGQGSFFSAIALYRRAVRLAPDFPDRDRGRLMIGFAHLAISLAAEAEGEFIRLSREATDTSVVSLALLGAGRAARAAGRHGRAAKLLHRAIASGARSDGACRARVNLGMLLAESGRGAEGLALFDEMRELCQAGVARAPRTLLHHAGVLAAAGRLKEAEQLLLALPEFEGELFVRRKFLEADIASATGVPEIARRAYETVRASPEIPATVRAEATLRLARLEDDAGNADRAGVLLGDLATGRRAVNVRAKALATTAELLARRGRYPEALDVLERADVLGPAGLTAAEAKRPMVFRSWIASLAKQDDDTGILTVFYRYRGDGIGRHLRPQDVVRVAEAATRVGLHDLAIQILSPVYLRTRGEVRTAARRLQAQAALAMGENVHALRLVDPPGRSGEGASRLAAVERLRGEALLRLGRLDEAAMVLQPLRKREDLVALGTAYLHEADDADKAAQILQAAVAGTEEASEQLSPAVLDGWLTLADAADAAGNQTLAAGTVRTTLRLFGDQPAAGLRYRLAQLESAGADPASAAASYAGAAEAESDPLFARAAAASAAYYRVLERHPEDE
jgi:tetratricopeptide (TPR) repeat protein